MRIKKKLATLVAVTVIAMWGMQTAKASAEDLSAEAGVDVLSNYVWRGQKLSDDKGVIQPYIDISFNGFGANYWANYDLENSEHTETDLTLSWSTEVDRVSIGLGYINYALDGADDTQEVYFSLEYDILLTPSLTLYYDFDEGEGGFLIASVGHTFTLPREASLNLGASVSVNLGNRVMGLDSRGDEFTNFYNGELAGSVSLPIGSVVTVEPKVAWTFPLSDDAETAIESLSFDNDSSTVYGGVNISAGF